LLLWFLVLVGYEKGVKKKGIAGNLFVGVVASSPLLYGAWLGGSVAAGVIPALFAFLLHLAREIVKDIGDAPGDEHAGRRTLPIRMGEKNAFLLSAFPLLFLVLFTPIPFLLGVYDVRYLVTVLIGMDVVLLVFLAGCYFHPQRWSMALLSRVLKGEMVIAMIAILLGSGV
jgi:geranylgeranylglycerol-phosphate geranylgeranyltransferase